MVKKMAKEEPNYNIGLCFKIYVHKNTTDKRYEIVDEFLNSLNKLIDNYDNLMIVGIIDSKITSKLEPLLRKINDKIKIIVLNENKGISFATNIGIEFLLNYNCDYIFCCDDDIIIKDASVLDMYINNLIDNNIKHLGYYPLNVWPTGALRMARLGNPGGLAIKNNLIAIQGRSGCFYCLTKECIYDNGYLPILDGKYGFEHECFTKKITGFQYDVLNSNNYIMLNTKSILHDSGQTEKNLIASKNDLEKYVSENFWKNQVKHTEYTWGLK